MKKFLLLILFALTGCSFTSGYEVTWRTPCKKPTGYPNDCGERQTVYSCTHKRPFWSASDDLGLFDTKEEANKSCEEARKNDK